MAAQKKVVLMGNPGAGKSTLLNWYIQDPVFTSGISLGTGVTTVLQRHVLNGTVYIDTPGLTDVKIRSQSVEAIFSALTEGGQYENFFL